MGETKASRALTPCALPCRAGLFPDALQNCPRRVRLTRIAAWPTRLDPLTLWKRVQSRWASVNDSIMVVGAM